ncbi:MAG TPA: 5-demethoxyubiquinol-8 5-hydroxylase UbiM [Burkholderiaceae bacterium]
MTAATLPTPSGFPPDSLDFDIAIVGAGPAGLCLARALSGHGLSIAVVEKQTRAALAAPAFDGREIALTQASRRSLERLGAWSHIPADAVSPLHGARVLDGPSSLFALRIGAGAGRELGCLVPNHHIRQAAYAAVQPCADVTLLDGVAVADVVRDAQVAQLRLESGTTLRTRLVVCADSRFSVTRRALGIGARMQDFGRTMLVCRVEHDQPHQGEAWEWFDYGQTLALLPLRGGHLSSVVLTLPQHAMQQVLALDDAAFGADMARRFQHRLGAMRTAGTRHAYPLVAAWAERFDGPRCALVGDAAVGMHPVTAHGFNFGLDSVERLARGVLAAHQAGRDVADPAMLARYTREHRLGTLPLYLATNLVAGLYSDERPPARLLRKAALHAAQRVAPFRRAIAAHLVGAA